MRISNLFRKKKRETFSEELNRIMEEWERSRKDKTSIEFNKEIDLRLNLLGEMNCAIKMEVKEQLDWLVKTKVIKLEGEK